MADHYSDYWVECVSIAAEECGAVLTPEQVQYIADSVQGSHENYSMAFGHNVASSNRWAEMEREKDDLRKKARREESMVTCRTCNGTGNITTYGGTFMSSSSCWKCSGRGRHDP